MAQSGEFRAFKVDLAIGYAKPSGSASSTDSTTSVNGGILIAIEPKYALNDNFTVGIRFETSLSANSNISSDTSSSFIGTQSAKSATSVLLTGDYYLTTGTIRPFIGGGVGIFYTGSASISIVDTTLASADGDIGKKVGFVPRAGFELGHFRAAVEYNIIGKSNNTNYNYWGFKVGFFFGGGRLGGNEGSGGRGRNKRSPNNRGDDFVR